MKNTHLVSEKFSKILKKTMIDLQELKEMRMYLCAKNVMKTAQKYSFSLKDLSTISKGESK